LAIFSAYVFFRILKVKKYLQIAFWTIQLRKFVTFFSFKQLKTALIFYRYSSLKEAQVKN